MADVRIDASGLSGARFLIPQLNTGWIDAADTALMSLQPGAYDLQQALGITPAARFSVTPAGLFDYDAASETYLEGRGTSTLIVRGITITFDATQLSHDLLLLVTGGSVLSKDRPHQLTLLPASGYRCQPATGIIADFSFDVNVNGTVTIDSTFGGFAEAGGLVLTLRGYRVTIDARQLSHALLPVSMLGNVGVLSNDRIHEMTFIPGTGYRFQPATGIIADFRFDVHVNGTVVIDPSFTGFAEASGLMLTVRGYRVTIDARQLSHALLPVSMLGNVGVLSNDRIHEMTFIPGTGYRFQPATGIIADFRFDVHVNGTVVIDPSFSGFAEASGLMLTLRGYRVTIDARQLSHALLPVSMLGNMGVLSNERTHELTFIPGAGYGFQPASGIVADFRFDVDVNGTVVIAPRFEGFAEASGLVLTLRGYRVRIDATKLSHALLPLAMLGNIGVLSNDRVHELTFIPGAGYGFQPASGIVADFRFDVDVGGTVVIDPRFEGFAETDGLELALRGYRVTIDGRQLSHALLPASMLGNIGVLSNDRTHQLTFIPAKGYGFQPASGIVADFRFDVDVSGAVVVDPRFAGFATARGLELIVNGYRVTVDGRQLSHALLPVAMLGDVGVLSQDRTHDLTFIPASGYGFQPAAGIVADFRFDLDVSGSVLVAPRFAGFAQVAGRSLTITGYSVSLDTGELSHDVVPSMLGWTSGSLPPGIHEIKVIPAVGYPLVAHDTSVPPIRFSVDVGGKVWLTDAPPGVTAASRDRFCGVPDDIVTTLQIQTYGAPRGRWSGGQLTVTIDLTNAPAGLGSPSAVTQEIRGAFFDWQRVVPQFFVFTYVPANGNILVAFGGRELSPKFGTPGGVLAIGKSPQLGQLLIDSSEMWTPAMFRMMLLHEIGHLLGLAHSDNSTSIMFPTTGTSATGIDQESQDAIRNLYGWRPQIVLADRATSDRPAMAVASHTGLTFNDSILHMVWKGTRDDQGIYESSLRNNVWTAQSLVNGARSSQSPSLATFPLHDGTPSTGLVMAWKGSNDDQSLFFAINRRTGWPAPTRVPNVGSSHRPALAEFGVTHMAWKGIRGDSGIYWSRLTPAGWEAQRNVRGVGTTVSPALVKFQNRLFMFWKGIEGDSRIYFSSLDAHPNADWRPQQVVAYENFQAGGTQFVHVGTTHGPSAAQHGNRILLAWKGVEGDSGIYFSLFDGTAFTGQIRLFDAGTSEGPCVCRIGEHTHMTWKGIHGDGRVYWSTLAGGL